MKMEIELNNIRVKNLVNLMKSIRMVEDTEIFWRSSESLHEEVTVYWVDDYYYYPGFLIDTGRGFIFVRREMLGITYSNIFSIENLTGSNWVEYLFEPAYDIYGLARKCKNVFEGGFMDACKYVLDSWMSRR